ncbi:MAG: hypothetical protein CW342_06190 [Thermoactinomycetaceae bacterium]|nr:hypothetical protein [Thermoactinomycetaceae bacterium]
MQEPAASGRLSGQEGDRTFSGAMEGGSGRQIPASLTENSEAALPAAGRFACPLFGGSIRMHAVKVPAMGNLLKQNAFFPRLRLAGGGEAVGREDPVIAPVQVVGVPFVLDRGKGAVRRQGGGMTAFRFLRRADGHRFITPPSLDKEGGETDGGLTIKICYSSFRFSGWRAELRFPPVFPWFWGDWI